MNKEGAGIILVGANADPPGGIRDFGTGTLNINGGTFGSHQTLNIGAINVASGAALQPGLAPGGSLGTNATITFQNNSGLRILTDGTLVSQLQNATMTKGLNDTFVVTLAGLNPSGTETFNLSNAIFFQGTLLGFDPNDTYTQASPGHFSVVGSGFTVTDWSLSVVNRNQLHSTA